MHRKIVLHLQPMATPTEAMDASEEDWLRDTMGEAGGGAGLSKQRFIVSWFELGTPPRIQPTAATATERSCRPRRRPRGGLALAPRRHGSGP